MPTFPHPTLRRGAALTLLLLGGLPAGAQQINTGTPPPSGAWPIFTFGRPLSGTQYSSLGQSFTVAPGPTQLSSFQFWVNQAAGFETLPFYAYLFPWDDPSRSITGSYLYRSAPQTGFATVGVHPLAFSTGGLNLAAGATYLAVLSSAEFPAAPPGHFGGIFESTGGVASTYAGGAAYARISLASGGLGGLSAGPWAFPGGTTTGLDLAFTATFTAPPPPPSTVPEPTTIALVGGGLLALVGARRHRRARRG